MDAPPPPSPPEIAAIAHGPMFVGLGLNLILYGIMITQVYLYFSGYKHDQIGMKLFVVALFVLDTANTAFDFAYLYECFVAHYGEVVYLSKATWVFSTDPALTGIIATLVQLFFAWRIKILTSNMYITSLVAFLALFGLAGSLATAVEASAIHPNFVEFHVFKEDVIIWLASECLCDIIISGVLVFHLYVRLLESFFVIAHDWHRRGKKTGFQDTDDLVDRIIRMTMQTGSATAVCALIDLITFLAMDNGIHLIFNFPLCKLYTNSLMSSLNAREIPRTSRGGTTSATLSVSGGNGPQLSRPSESNSRPVSRATFRPTMNSPGPIAVEMTVTKRRDSVGSKYETSSDHVQSSWKDSQETFLPKNQNNV